MWCVCMYVCLPCTIGVSPVCKNSKPLATSVRMLSTKKALIGSGFSCNKSCRLPPSMYCVYVCMHFYIYI